MSENKYGEIREGKVFRKAINGFPEKEIGEVKETEEAAFAYYEQRFSHLEEKINQLEQDVHATTNKGSYLMKLLHMKETLPDYDGLGDFPALHKKLEALEEHIQEVINQNRRRNLEIKTALLAEGEQLKEVTNWKEAGQFAKDLKMRWIKTGSLDPEHQDEYEAKFNALIDDFFARRNAFFEDRNQMIEDRIASYKALIEKARKVVEQAEGREAAEKIKAIQAEWKEVGQVPAQTRTELWEELQVVVKPVFTANRRQPKRSHTGREQRSFNPDALKVKKKLLEQLNNIEGCDKEALDHAYKLQDEFKAQGFAPGAEGEEINTSFYQTLGLMKEKHFLNNLAQAKTRDFESKNESEQAKVKLRLLRDLLGRDERELQNFQENLASLTTGKNKVNKMMDAKLRLQERKVEVKRLLLKELQQQI